MFKPSGTIADALRMNAHVVQQCQPQVCCRRAFCIAKIAAGLESSVSTPRDQDWQVLMTVLVAVRDTAAIHNGGMVQQRAFPFLDRFQLSKKLSKVLRVKRIDTCNFFDVVRIAAMVR